MNTQSKIYVWVNNQTGEFLRMKSKVAWQNSAAAKNAFSLHMQGEDFAAKLREQAGVDCWVTVDQLWAKQDIYHLVEMFFEDKMFCAHVQAI